MRKKSNVEHLKFWQQSNTGVFYKKDVLKKFLKFAGKYL